MFSELNQVPEKLSRYLRGTFIIRLEITAAEGQQKENIGEARHSEASFDANGPAPRFAFVFHFIPTSRGPGTNTLVT